MSVHAIQMQRTKINKRLRPRGLKVMRLRPVIDPKENAYRAIVPWAVATFSPSTYGKYNTIVARFQTLDDIERAYP